MALDLTAIRQRIDKAHTEVGEICRRTGASRWRMSIPANPDRDSDLIISQALRDAEALAAEVAWLRGELKASVPHRGDRRHPMSTEIEVINMTERRMGPGPRQRPRRDRASRGTSSQSRPRPGTFRKALRNLAKATADYQHAVAAWADLERSLKRRAGRQMTLGRTTPTPPQETP